MISYLEEIAELERENSSLRRKNKGLEDALEVAKYKVYISGRLIQKFKKSRDSYKRQYETLMSQVNKNNKRLK